MPALELVVSHASPPRRRLESRWYATGPDNRPPLWREIAFEILRRALESRVALRRLLLLLFTAVVLVTGAAAALTLLVPPHLLTGLTGLLAVGGWWMRRRASPAPAPADHVTEATEPADSADRTGG